jgi:3-deoxy-7-phosphoheptulonate synthase
MIIQLKQEVSESQKEKLIARINEIGYKVTEVKTQMGDYLIGIGKTNFDIRKVGHLEGIQDIHIVSDDYKLVSRKWKVSRTHVDLGDGVVIGNGLLSIMTGPCSIEKEIRRTIV